ncbi:hypothetical protein GF325_04330 [Candidatus Bathyarchaeota archaeon]|nr:hypothetical protein [Candidatus Bathyarchaeota archaeon]
MRDIKICGIDSVKTAVHAGNSGATMVGMVMGVPESPRNLEHESARKMALQIPHPVKIVLVCRTLSNKILEHASTICHDYLQFHDVRSIHLLDTREHACRSRCIIGIDYYVDEPKLAMIGNFIENQDILLLDGSQGSGKQLVPSQLHETFDMLEHALGLRASDVMVAGGFDVENIETFLDSWNPRGVDASSGLEREPGVKDLNLIEQFCKIIRNHDQPGERHT